MRTADLLYLIEASQRLHLSDILDKLDDGVIAVDAEGRICFENKHTAASSACRNARPLAETCMS